MLLVKCRLLQIVGVPAGLCVLLAAGTLPAQTPYGTRPIEFSEPRGEKAPITNAQTIGSERSSLSRLEERLSSTFDVFKLGDSMSGAPAAPPLPRPRVVVPRQTDKGSGLFDEDKDWLLGDLLGDSKEPSIFQSLLEGRKDAGRGDRLDGLGESPNPLDNLRGDNWLLRGIWGDSYWNKTPGPDLTGTLRPGDNAFQPFEALPATDPMAGSGASQLEGVMGMNRPAANLFGISDAQEMTGERDFGTRLASPFSRDYNQRRDAYRSLLGMEPRLAPATPNPFDTPNSGGSLPQTTRPSTPAFSQPAQGWNTQAPTAPRRSFYSDLLAPPKPPTATPSLEPVQDWNTPPTRSRPANPFIEPPRRGF